MPRKSDQFSVIGKRQPRLDGVSKATGRSKFTDDVNLPGMLHAKIVRSPIPSGKIINIDTSKAEKLPGVKAVITSNDTNGLMAGPDEFVFCENDVKFFGDEVAAVAAVDEDTAAEAARLIQVDYEPTKALFSMEEALAKGAPAVHEHCEDNIADDRIMTFGDIDKALADADYIREDEYKINPNHQCFAENHVVVADYSLPDRLTIWTPMQVASIPQSNLAFKLGLSESKVRIMNLNSGGCFCGRGSEKTHHYAALILSRKTGRPVKLHCTADEEFLVFRGGGTYNFKFKTGVMKDGTLKAADVDLLLDSGAYMDVQFINLMFIGQCIQMLYKMDASKFTGRLVHGRSP